MFKVEVVVIELVKMEKDIAVKSAGDSISLSVIMAQDVHLNTNVPNVENTDIRCEPVKGKTRVYPKNKRLHNWLSN